MEPRPPLPDPSWTWHDGIQKWVTPLGRTEEPGDYCSAIARWHKPRSGQWVRVPIAPGEDTWQDRVRVAYRICLV